MKHPNAKRFLGVILALVMLIGVAACSSPSPSSVPNSPAASNASPGTSNAPAQPGKPDTWIADRTIVVRTFNGDQGEALPEDQLNNAVTQKIKELTGITLMVEYNPGPSSLQSLTTALAAGDLPDAISHYLNDSTRPEYPVVLKYAREGLLTDIAPFLRESKVYSKYYEDGYLPADTYNNIIQREEFGGATYIVHMRINRTEDVKENDLRGGMYIQKSIVDQLGINPWEVTTQEEFYDLLVKIKEGGFKDAFGNDVTPIGPAFWGGGNNVRRYAFEKYMTGGTVWEVLDGRPVHQIQTESVMDEIRFARKLMSDGLMHKEFFTMDESRAKEGALSYSFAIVEDVHSGVTDLFDKAEYVPLGPLVDKYDRNIYYTRGKSGYGAWSIPTSTKNPEEIVKFADFMASKEGKLLWQYGIEGEHYDMVDGKPHVKQELLDKMQTDPNYLRNLNIWAGGAGSSWGTVFGQTDMDTFTDFGEVAYGENTDPERNAKGQHLVNYGLEQRPYDKTIFTSGFEPNHFTTEFENGDELRDMLDSNAYNEIIIQAIFAKSEQESQAIIDNYRTQLEKQGLNEFEEYLAGVIQSSPEMVNIRSKDE